MDEKGGSVQVGVRGTANGQTIQYEGSARLLHGGSGEVELKLVDGAGSPLRWDPVLIVPVVAEALELVGHAAPAPGLSAALDARQLLRDESGREVGRTVAAVELAAAGAGSGTWLRVQVEIEEARCSFEVGERVLAVEEAVRSPTLRGGIGEAALLSFWTLCSSRESSYRLATTLVATDVRGSLRRVGLFTGTVDRSTDGRQVRFRLWPVECDVG